jgi:hypothetical protein
VSDKDLVNYKIFLFHGQLIANHLGFQVAVAAIEILNTALPSMPEMDAAPDNA